MQPRQKRIALALAFSLTLGISPAFAQQRTPAPIVQPTVASAIDAQWEYLVVTYGKTLFGNPEKTLAYRAIGLSATAQEANEVQRSLDVLGRFGWEIITIVGSIGGDQQIVFKRRYDRARATNESMAILKGKEIYLKDLIDIIEREKRVREEALAVADAERQKPRLIELDAQEQEARRAAAIAERQAAYNAALAATPWGPKVAITVRGTLSFTSVELKVDVTGQVLQDGNAYRKSEVTSWLKKTVLPTLRAASPTSAGSVFISAAASINFQGNTVVVATEKSDYSPYTGKWTD